MPADYIIPPWVSQPADPAANYATGLQIGVRIGAEQAAQRLAQQQMLRAQVESEFKQQYQTAKLALEIDEITRKQRAVSGFNQALQSGIPADQALMRFGPDMGENVASVLRAQDMQRQHAAQLEETKRYHSGLLDSRSAGLDVAERNADLRAREADLRAKDIERKAARYSIPEDVKQKIRSYEKEIDALNKRRLELFPEADEEVRGQSLELASRAQNLQRRIDKLTAKNAPKVPETVAEAMGQEYSTVPEPRPNQHVPVGAIVEQDGRRYRFNGGDPHIPENYTLVQ